MIYFFVDHETKRDKMKRDEPYESKHKQSESLISESSNKKKAASDSRKIGEVSPKKESLFKKQNKEEKKNGISVDISKFVQEVKGSINERYVVESAIGKGAYGEVSLIKDKISNNTRAMKVIPKEICNTSNSSSVVSEINMLKSLDHPNIIKMYEFYQDESNYYLVTEYCSGGELYDRIIAMRNFSEFKAAELMKQILSAVTYCHKRNIVHRDIKPENLLFESKEENANLKVIDFGTSMVFGHKKMSQKLGTVFLL